jgi:hypothetical protein
MGFYTAKSSFLKAARGVNIYFQEAFMQLETAA